MEYPAINKILAAVCERLQEIPDPAALAQPLLREIRTACITGYENLFALLPDLTAFPAAIVAAGNLSFPEMATVREVELAVIIIDEFRASPELAVAGYDLVDRFAGCLTGPFPGAALELDGVHFITEGIQPLELDGDHTGWQYTLKATAGFLS